MTTIHVTLPEPLRDKIAQRAAEQGHSSVEKYVEALLREDAEQEDMGAPDDLTASDGRHLEALIAEGVNSGDAREISSGEWEAMGRRLVERYSRKDQK